MADDRRVFGNRYEIIRHIARGGMAQVYLARDLLLDRPVALKVLFPELSLDEAFVERFRREAQAAANLSHPNIVSIYDWGQGDNTYYIVMEFVDGETLSARIRRGPLQADEAAAIGIATTAALSFAHSHNVIHRDVKPGNVLIDKFGHVKVADFGIARAVGSAERITQAGAVMGTATYFSPEQAQGHNVDARSDVYSLGVVLYEMAVGNPPFQGDNPVAIAYKHVGQLPRAPRTVKPSIPPGYEAIALKALAKDPVDRYQSAAALRIDLERFRAGQAVGAAAADTTIALPADDSRAVAGRDATIAMAPGNLAMGAGTGAGRPPAATTLNRPRHIAGPSPSYDAGDDTGPLVESRSRTRLYVGLLVLLVIALAALGYLIGRSYGLFGGVRALTVPSVSGRPAPAAAAGLRSAGFTHVTEKRITSPTVPVGIAIDTVPGAGSRERSNFTITVDVSLGQAPVEVPSVAGDARALAVATLDHLGFKTKLLRHADSTVAKGDVIRTSPAGGTSRPPGSEVEVIVSSGRPQVQIPDVTYEPPAPAGAELNNLGLHVTERRETSMTVLAGEVTRTTPPAGASALVGATVTVYVSDGPAVVTLPSVLGDTQARATAVLSGLGLKPLFITEVVATPDQNGLVQITDPLPGMTVERGSRVVVAVGSYTAPTTTTSTSTTTTTTTTTTSTTVPTSTTTPSLFGGSVPIPPS